MMIELSDAQMALLLTAVARENRCLYPVTTALKGGAVGNVAASLLKRGLLEEVEVRDDATVWRCAEDGTLLTLRATEAAVRFASSETVPPDEPAEPCVEGRAAPSAKRGAAQEALLAILLRPEGGTIANMQEATGWLAHSVRGALSGVIAKKLGHNVASVKEADRGRVYRIVGAGSH